MKPNQDLVRALLAICQASRLRTATRAANQPRLERGERRLSCYTRGRAKNGA